MSRHSNDHQAVIRAAGHRVTPQPVLILDVVCESGGHTTLDEVYARVRQLYSAIDRSTPYRTVKLFVELGLVVSADSGDGETYYRIGNPLRLPHLICRQRGHDCEIDHSVMQSMLDLLLKTWGFTADSDHLVVFGLCNFWAQANQP